MGQHDIQWGQTISGFRLLLFAWYMSDFTPPGKLFKGKAVININVNLNLLFGHPNCPKWKCNTNFLCKNLSQFL